MSLEASYQIKTYSISLNIENFAILLYLQVDPFVRKCAKKCLIHTFKIESLEMVDLAIENYTPNVCDHFTVGLQFRIKNFMDPLTNLKDRAQWPKIADS